MAVLMEGRLMERSICSIKGNVFLKSSRQMRVTTRDRHHLAFFGRGDCISKFAALAVRRGQRPKKDRFFAAGNLYRLSGKVECHRSIAN